MSHRLTSCLVCILLVYALACFSRFDEALPLVATDPRLPELRQRCTLYDGFVRWGRGMSEEEYAQVEEGACVAALPPESPGNA
jgi:hypothetical protein